MKINPARRAEIGREKRARTRAQLVAAARGLFAGQTPESVTVDDVVREAGVAKGTFYVHFESLDSLIGAVGEELVSSFDDLLQPGRLSLVDPAQRITFGCRSFLQKATANPHWARLAARMAAIPGNSGETLRLRLFEDLEHLFPETPEAGATAELHLEIVFGIMLQLTQAIGEGRLSAADMDAPVYAILRAIGLSDRKAKSTLDRVSRTGNGFSQ
ncbi:TetR/AcrR family transcriptional regulator [Pannonibacter sp.]|uniref:TetR/AcrR family transcriptional regulator n=1 Tax=Pannonibacter sp. TaxID=1906786 RepID=UPI003F6E9DCA